MFFNPAEILQDDIDNVCLALVSTVPHRDRTSFPKTGLGLREGTPSKILRGLFSIKYMLRLQTSVFLHN